MAEKRSTGVLEGILYSDREGRACKMRYNPTPEDGGEAVYEGFFLFGKIGKYSAAEMEAEVISATNRLITDKEWRRSLIENGIAERSEARACTLAARKKDQERLDTLEKKLRKYEAEARGLRAKLNEPVPEEPDIEKMEKAMDQLFVGVEPITQDTDMLAARMILRRCYGRLLYTGNGYYADADLFKLVTAK